MTQPKLFYLFISVVMVAMACNNPAPPPGDTEISDSAVSVQADNSVGPASESSFQFDLIIANNIAAPVKLLTDMSQAGLKNYQDNITNPVKNSKNYVTANQKALNFGIYGADLSYKSLYGKQEDMVDYLLTIRSLAGELGMSDLFNQEAYEKFEQIKNQPDSVKMFIYRKYDEADNFLRSNDRLLTASLIITGGLVESLHLVSSQIEKGTANKDAYKIFLGQKNTLKNLLNLYESLEKEGHKVDVKKDIESLYTKFEEMDSFEKFSKENIHTLHLAIDEVRNKFV